ncbi:MAG: 2-amino-4-hydroxy-6-hydroxymethyldihydropteridine diphosphokinase [Bacteroidetes bacterium]|nr:2-amino-4-hydroxy-6-hydroxymethyldihydropteridine diphosphokinase [Bacteroidota bacterium]
MLNKIFLGLGSNVGNSLSNIKNAVNYINNDKNCLIVNYSSIYETKPYGNVEQSKFLNCVIEISSLYSAKELLDFIKSLEIKLGRIKREKWGPREIDLDILFYNDHIFESDNLQIPHPELIKRDFVLVPMLEIEPFFEHPISKKLLKEYLDSISENHILNKLKIDLLN